MTRNLYIASGLFLFVVMLGYYFGLSAPASFPTGTIITLPKGVGVSALARELESEHVIRSAGWFRVAVITFGGEHSLQAGDYYLPSRESAWRIAWRMIKSERDLALVKMTIPEGFTVKDAAALFDSRFPLFDKQAFLRSAAEGYIFPDTYFVAINATASSSIELFTSNFNRQFAKYAGDITASKHSEKEIITMASILEAEVKTETDMKLVSGVLWKRLSLGMPLQIDSAPGTYKTPGLPTTPIDNPGLVAIGAALHPTASPYLYFLSDKSGTIHYAKTIDEQTRNIQKYL